MPSTEIRNTIADHPSAAKAEAATYFPQYHSHEATFAGLILKLFDEEIIRDEWLYKFNPQLKDLVDKKLADEESLRKLDRKRQKGTEDERQLKERKEAQKRGQEQRKHIKSEWLDSEIIKIRKKLSKIETETTALKKEIQELKTKIANMETELGLDKAMVFLSKDKAGVQTVISQAKKVLNQS